MKKTVKTILMAVLLTTAFSTPAFAEMEKINDKQANNTSISELKTEEGQIKEEKEFINSGKVYTSDINYGSIKASSFFEGKDEEYKRKYYAYYNTNSVILGYNQKLAEAVNKGDMAVFKGKLKVNSSLYNAVKKEVTASYKAGIKEEFIDSMVLDYSYDKIKKIYKVNVYEEYDIKKADNSVKNTKYNWIYSIDSNLNIISRTKGTEKNLGQYSRLIIKTEKETLKNYKINYHMYAVNKQGEKQWEKVWKNIPMAQLEPASPYVISDDEVIYIVVEGKLYALDKYSGKEKWKNKISVGSCAHAPVIHSDGTIYCTGFHGPFVTAVNPDGTVKWSRNYKDIYWPHKTILDDNHIYVYFSGGVDIENAYVVLDKDGNVVDSKLTEEVNTDDIVNIVKDGHFNSYNSYSVGTAFDSFFQSPKWTYFKSTDGRDIVEFTGQCDFNNVLVNILFQFNVNTSDRSFQLIYSGKNGIYLEDYLLKGLLDKIFE